MASKRPLDDEVEPGSPSDVYVSDSIHDRKSTFIGYFSPNLPANALQGRAELKSATHRIAAWRTPSKQTTLKSSAALSQQRAYKTGHDDDGEQWAGKRLEKVLEELNVQGSVVVARWYGGVMLGPVRFSHIEDVAKQAIRKWQHRNDARGPDLKRARVDANGESLSIPQTSTVMRPEDVQRKKEALIAELQQRDHSITVLRDLLDQKRAKLAEYANATPQSSPSKPTTSPSKQPDYSSMTLMRLQALDKARDASIEFLLKQINAAEEEEKRLAEEDAAGEEAANAAWESFEQETSKERTDGQTEQEEATTTTSAVDPG